MKGRFLLVLVLAAFLLVVLVVPAFAQTPSPFLALPDYGSGISANVGQFFQWDAVSGPLTFVIALSIAGVGIVLLLRSFGDVNWWGDK